MTFPLADSPSCFNMTRVTPPGDDLTAPLIHVLSDLIEGVTQIRLFPLSHASAE